MAIDYVLFIHGVNNRDEQGVRRNFGQLFDRIRASVNDPSRNLKPIYLFWGNVGAEPTQALNEGLKASPQWSKFWFQDFRTQQIVPFVGDAALYLSRYASAQIVRQFITQAAQQMGMSQEGLRAAPYSGDRIHFVTHSWGTVILFDILFAPRWEAAEVDSETRQNVERIRTAFFGVGNDENRQLGFPIASIHTMGSPIALFSLLNIAGSRSFNLTPNLKDLLESLSRLTGKPLPWYNYAHPGDPIAYPLAGVLPLLLEEARKDVKIADVVTQGSFFWQLFSQTLLPILDGGNAHGSYWDNREVSATIAQVIRDA